MTTVVALAPDLMDRTRIEAAAGGRVTFVSRLDALRDVDVDVVVADLTRVDDPAELRRLAPNARIIAFGPHVDDVMLDAARDADIDDVLPRSVFFKVVGDLLA